MIQSCMIYAKIMQPILYREIIHQGIIQKNMGASVFGKAEGLGGSVIPPGVLWWCPGEGKGEEPPNNFVLF